MDRSRRTGANPTLERAGIGAAFVVVRREEGRRHLLAPDRSDLAAVQTTAGGIHDGAAVVVLAVAGGGESILLHEADELVRRRELRGHLPVGLPALGRVVEE